MPTIFFPFKSFSDVAPTPVLQGLLSYSIASCKVSRAVVLTGHSLSFSKTNRGGVYSVSYSRTYLDTGSLIGQRGNNLIQIVEREHLIYQWNLQSIIWNDPRKLIECNNHARVVSMWRLPWGRNQPTHMASLLSLYTPMRAVHRHTLSRMFVCTLDGLALFSSSNCDYAETQACCIDVSPDLLGS
ncbi:hypothetical protein F5Y12DRAFT_756137 [Xylaria sp. FL1777]|nr:hypothetical protein F5Y12DRAFT_756137 [Xylaria sp. FL1777]